jgi:large subunit ribosomal protein L3
MKFILGKKVNMTQMFDENGRVYPATLVLAEPNKVSDIKTEERDGYKSIQVSVGKTKKEFRVDDITEYKKDQEIDVTLFEAGDKIQVSGISKGKGFQGVVKRHGFHGGPRSHGQKHSEREPGSIGATGPQRVFKGTKMGGRMGSDRVTVTNLKVLQIDKEKNEILISGAVPGKRGTLLEIREF